MPDVLNPFDQTRISFEDEGGHGAPVVFLGGFLDSVDEVRVSHLSRSLSGGEFRRIYVDHRGLGKSEKPHNPAAYGMRFRAFDPITVLDALGLPQAHFIGLSWGGRLVFGIGEHAPERALSLVAIGQQPYAWPDSPLTRAVTAGIALARSEGTVAVVDALAKFWGVDFPIETRLRWVENDPAALAAMWEAVVHEGPVSRDLRSWRVPCLICLGSGDGDFIELARRAAAEIPGARFVELAGSDHYRAHVSEDEALVEAVLSTLRSSPGEQQT